jgi:hypothetical protein
MIMPLLFLAITFAGGASANGFEPWPVKVELSHERCSSNRRASETVLAKELESLLGPWKFQPGKKADHFLIQARFQEDNSAFLRLHWKRRPDLEEVMVRNLIDVSTLLGSGDVWERRPCAKLPAVLQEGLRKYVAKEPDWPDEWRKALRKGAPLGRGAVAWSQRHKVADMFIHQEEKPHAILALDGQEHWNYSGGQFEFAYDSQPLGQKVTIRSKGEGCVALPGESDDVGILVVHEQAAGALVPQIHWNQLTDLDKAYEVPFFLRDPDEETSLNFETGCRNPAPVSSTEPSDHLSPTVIPIGGGG